MTWIVRWSIPDLQMQCEVAKSVSNPALAGVLADMIELQEKILHDTAHNRDLLRDLALYITKHINNDPTRVPFTAAEFSEKSSIIAEQLWQINEMRDTYTDYEKSLGELYG
jgi:hypothetical protein